MTVGDRDRHHVILRTDITDRRGVTYAVHEPTGPAQVGEVYRLFLRGGYPKSISERDHFLVVSNDREQVIGGVCYQLLGEGVVHLDGIVVAQALHERGITSAVLEDFASRMADAGHRIIKTHFFLRGFYLKRRIPDRPPLGRPRAVPLISAAGLRPWCERGRMALVRPAWRPARSHVTAPRKSSLCSPCRRMRSYSVRGFSPARAAVSPTRPSQARSRSDR